VTITTITTTIMKKFYSTKLSVFVVYLFVLADIEIYMNLFEYEFYIEDYDLFIPLQFSEEG
jgi:hypothetical protein